MKFKPWFAVILTLTLLLEVIGASACTTIYVGGNLTQEGTPFVARTEDYGSDMNKMWFISEAGAYKAGEQWIGCPAYGAFEWTFTHDTYRFTYFTNDIFNGACPECGVENPTHWSYTEFGTNEKGVSVSATETISGNEQVKEIDPNVTEKVDGIVGIEETDIPTILLAEADSARAGVELLADIYDNYGAYYDSGLFICDQNEVWYIENCSGTQYIALKLNDDMIFLEPNLSVIGAIDLDDSDNVIASERLIAVAEEAGTFVGDAAENIIDYRASYANLGTADAPRVGAPRMVDGLNFLNEELNVTEADLAADNSLFTISNLKDGEIVPLYTNISADRTLTKDDVFDYYKLSSIGKPSNQEIEIFQLFRDRPLETATVGWVGVGNMSNNVFIPYYPLLLEDVYEGYQVSTAVVERVPTTQARPEGFCTYATSWRTGETFYVAYPENWRDSYYFAFEGLGGYILYAEQIDGAPVSDEQKRMVLDRLSALQREINAQFEAMSPEDTTEVGMDMAKRAHTLALELIDEITAR
ncbi:MAG: C69 family dipeptidase [Clostridia bacterium]|nr:C69 family dipeptidase [Clostridia bacterium]